MCVPAMAGMVLLRSVARNMSSSAVPMGAMAVAVAMSSSALSQT